MGRKWSEKDSYTLRKFISEGKSIAYIMKNMTIVRKMTDDLISRENFI